MSSLRISQANEANPNLPHDVVPLNAFNLIPGAAFMLIDQPDPTIWVALSVARSSSFEEVSVWARTHDGETAAAYDDNHRAFVLGYCTNVGLVGLVVNPSDLGDDNIGSN